MRSSTIVIVISASLCLPTSQHRLLDDRADIQRYRDEHACRREWLQCSWDLTTKPGGHSKWGFWALNILHGTFCDNYIAHLWHWGVSSYSFMETWTSRSMWFLNKKKIKAEDVQILHILSYCRHLVSQKGDRNFAELHLISNNQSLLLIWRLGPIWGFFIDFCRTSTVWLGKSLFLH